MRCINKIEISGCHSMKLKGSEVKIFHIELVPLLK